jgi:hypothetical protein
LNEFGAMYLKKIGRAFKIKGEQKPTDEKPRSGDFNLMILSIYCKSKHYRARFAYLRGEASPGIA